MHTDNGITEKPNSYCWYRFSGTSGGEIINNLANGAIVSRDGGSATLASNVASAESSWFMDADSGDLHLTSSASGVVDAGQTVSDVTDDYDSEERPSGSAYDIGGDEDYSL